MFDISHMTDQEIDLLFHSDFKILAKFMNGMDNIYEIQEKIEFPDPLLKILSVLTGDDRFEALKGEFLEGGSTMCDILDKVENKGIQKGKIEGKIEGKLEAYKETAKSLFENGASFELVIASIPDLPKDEIQKIFDDIFKK